MRQTGGTAVCSKSALTEADRRDCSVFKECTNQGRQEDCSVFNECTTEETGRTSVCSKSALTEADRGLQCVQRVH